MLRRLDGLPRSHDRSALSQTRVFHPLDRNPHASSLRKQHRSRHDVAGLAIDALNDFEIEPGLLNLLTRWCMPDRFDRGDRRATDTTDCRDAGAGRRPVQMDR
jgi:hypothetical protein